MFWKPYAQVFAYNGDNWRFRETLFQSRTKCYRKHVNQPRQSCISSVNHKHIRALCKLNIKTDINLTINFAIKIALRLERQQHNNDCCILFQIVFMKTLSLMSTLVKLLGRQFCNFAVIQLPFSIRVVNTSLNITDFFRIIIKKLTIFCLSFSTLINSLKRTHLSGC